MCINFFSIGRSTQYRSFEKKRACFEWTFFSKFLSLFTFVHERRKRHLREMGKFDLKFRSVWANKKSARAKWVEGGGGSVDGTHTSAERE